MPAHAPVDRIDPEENNTGQGSAHHALVSSHVHAHPPRAPRTQGSTEDLAPMAYWLGHLSAVEHAGQFRRATGALAQSTAERLSADAAARASGLIINTSGWVDGPGYDNLL